MAGVVGWESFSSAKFHRVDHEQFIYPVLLSQRRNDFRAACIIRMFITSEGCESEITNGAGCRG